MFEKENDERASEFYFTTKGIYKAVVESLETAQNSLDEELKISNPDKEKIKSLNKWIKSLRIQKSVIEELYRTAFE